MTITMNLDYFLCEWCLNCFSSYLTKTSTNSCINWTEEPKRIIISASCCFLIRQLQYVVSHFLAQILSSAHALNIQYTYKQVKMCTQVLIFFRFGYFFFTCICFYGGNIFFTLQILADIFLLVIHELKCKIVSN